MKIVHIILISFVSILLLFTFTTYINYRQSEELDDNSEKLAQSTLVISHCNRFQRNFLNMVSGLRGYLLTHEMFFIQTYDSAVVENEQILTDLTSLITNRPQQKQLLSDIHTLNEYWKSEFASPLLQAKQLTIESDSGKSAFKKLYQAKLTDGMEKKVQISLQKKFSDFTNTEYDYRTKTKNVFR